MNTTLSTTDNGNYTVVGGAKAGYDDRSYSVTLLILKRSGSIYNQGVLKEAVKHGFQDIVLVEGPGESYDVESLSRRYSTVRFLLLRKTLSHGEVINLGIQESKGRYVFVVWNDMLLLPIPPPDELINRAFEHDRLCLSPVHHNIRGELLPTVQAPAFAKRYLKILNLTPTRGQGATLFPYDMVGIYNKGRFSVLGGYDGKILNPHWQLLDFGFRAHMWGEEIHYTCSIRARYLTSPPVSDTSTDEGYLRFYLKNLAVRFNGESGYIPPSKFFSYLFKSGGNMLQARREFLELKSWVALNRFRFQCDSTKITELWEGT